MKQNYTPGGRYPDLPATPRQRSYIIDLGGAASTTMTRAEASVMIGRLKAGRAVFADVATGAPASDESGQQPQGFGELGIPMSMLEAVRNGRYAISLDGSDRLRFVRVNRIKERKGMSYRSRALIGFTRIQTQHSDDLINRALISPEGNVRLESRTMGLPEITAALVTIITDQRGAAIRYGQELGQCCVCGKALTDERSRYYGIGPDCEQRWPEIIDEVDDTKGAFVPSVGSW